MKTETKKLIGELLALITIGGLLLFIGFVTGFNTADPKFISSRIESCEEKGGKYNLVYVPSEYNYSEFCEIQENEIKDF